MEPLTTHPNTPGPSQKGLPIDGTIRRTVALLEARRSRPLERGRSDRHGGRTAKGRGGSILKGYPSEESCPGSHLQFQADPRHREWLCEEDAYANASIDDPSGTRSQLRGHRLSGRIFQPCYCACECPDLESTVTGSAIRCLGFIKIPARFGTTSSG